MELTGVKISLRRKGARTAGALHSTGGGQGVSASMAGEISTLTQKLEGLLSLLIPVASDGAELDYSQASLAVRLKSRLDLYSEGNLSALGATADAGTGGTGGGNGSGSLFGLMRDWPAADPGKGTEDALGANLGWELRQGLADARTLLDTHVADSVRHITGSERTRWNKAATDLSAIMGSDGDNILNKWEEIVAFLATYTEADTLANLLSNKADKSQLAGYVTLDTEQKITGQKIFGTHLLIDCPWNTHDRYLFFREGATSTYGGYVKYTGKDKLIIGTRDGDETVDVEAIEIKRGSTKVWLKGDVEIAGYTTVGNGLSVTGTVTADTIKRRGGTSWQFLMADGSIRNTADFILKSGDVMSGLLTLNAGALIPAGQSLTIGGCEITWDAAQGALRFSTSAYSEGEMASKGATSDSGSSSGGTTGGSSYDRLDSWAAYSSDKAGYVLSALLGYDLHTRLTQAASDIFSLGNSVRANASGITSLGNRLTAIEGLDIAELSDIEAAKTAVKNDVAKLYVTALGARGDVVLWYKNGVENMLAVPYATETSRLRSVVAGDISTIRYHRLTYLSSAVPLGTDAGQAREGSYPEFGTWSYPRAGVYAVENGNANIQALRLTWSGMYFHEIMTSPNYNDLWHRSVNAGKAGEWERFITTGNMYRYLGESFRLRRRYTVDLSHLDTGTFYPVMFGGDKLELDCEISSPQGVGTDPWNNNHIHFILTSWGWTDVRRTFSVLSCGVYDSNEITIGSVVAGKKQGNSCVFLRGGIKYDVIANREPEVQETGWTGYTGESYMPGADITGGDNVDVAVLWRNDSTRDDKTVVIRETLTNELATLGNSLRSEITSLGNTLRSEAASKYVTLATGQTITGIKRFAPECLRVEGEDSHYKYIKIFHTVNTGIPTADKDREWKIYHAADGSNFRGLAIWSYDGDGKIYNQVARFESVPTNALRVIGDVIARRFVRENGTSAMFLKADGSVDSTPYLPRSVFDELFVKELQADGSYAIRAKFSLYSDGEVTSKGAASGQGTGGSGVSYDRLDNWNDYDAGAGAVLSATLGYGLLSDINALRTDVTALKGAGFLTEHQDISHLLKKTDADAKYVAALGQYGDSLLWSKNGVSHNITLSYAKEALALRSTNGREPTPETALGTKMEISRYMNSGWWSSLTIGGANKSWNTWELCGPANMGDSSKISLRWRSGIGTFGDWKTILDNTNYASVLDADYVSKAGDKMTGRLTAPSIGINGAGSSAYLHASNNHDIAVNVSGKNLLVVDGSIDTVMCGDSVKGTVSLGTSSIRWKNVYATTINVSSAELVSKLNADMVDGHHEGDFLINRGSTYDGLLYDLPCKSFYSGHNIEDAPGAGWISGIVLGANFNSNHFQAHLVHRNDNDRWYVGRTYTDGKMTGWREIAFTNSNVASAIRLQTTRSIWGQGFNGTADISGDLKGVGNVFLRNNIMWNRDGDGTYLWGGAGTGNESIFSLNTHSAGVFKKQLLKVTGDGNFGINVYTPTYLLHVGGSFCAAGAAQLNSTLTVDGAATLKSAVTVHGQLTATSNAIVRGTLDVNGILTATNKVRLHDEMFFEPAGNAGPYLSPSGGKLSIAFHDNYTWVSTPIVLDKDGLLTLDGRLKIGGITMSYDASQGALRIEGNAYATGNIASLGLASDAALLPEGMLTETFIGRLDGGGETDEPVGAVIDFNDLSSLEAYSGWNEDGEADVLFNLGYLGINNGVVREIGGKSYADYGKIALAVMPLIVEKVGDMDTRLADLSNRVAALEKK